MKRPAFQFYPADWRKDTALQFCSLAAQGLWINTLCIAHECEPYGHLVLNGKPMTSAQIGRLVGLNAKECDKMLSELVDAGVCSKTDEGAFFSRRMVRDEDLRNRRASGGQAGAEHGPKGASHGNKGGRPKTYEGGINNPPSEGSRVDKEPPSEPPSEPPLKPPPSSSSSSSTSVEVKVKTKTARKRSAPAVLVSVDDMVAEGVDRQHATDWLLNRKTKGLAPLTPSIWGATKSEAQSAGIAVSDAIKAAAKEGWGGFKAKWLTAPDRNGQSVGMDMDGVH